MLRLPYDIEKGRIYEWLVNHKQGHERLLLTADQIKIVQELPEFFPDLDGGLGMIRGMKILLL